jgi:aspartyl-tRNA(Asn)/glutamyl-tRNA(Gln) amidotransferase subunit A
MDISQKQLASLPVHVLSAEIAARRLSPVTLIEAYIARIEALDEKLHAFVEPFIDDARLAAEAADKAIRSGHSVGPLHGIPVALKDLVELEGRSITGGSLIWSSRRAARTASLAKKMIQAGMIVIGRTHMVEFALGGWGANPKMGTPWNPWDLQTHRIPGGSSSGSAVAVAAGMAPWAIGTDTGGSVRLPAAYCGLTGLKPTAGRISSHGLMALSSTLDTAGVITRSVEDAAAFYELLQGPDPLDRNTQGRDGGDPHSNLKRGVAGMKFGKMPDEEREAVSADVLEAFDRAVDVLANAGADIEPIRLPCRFDDYADLSARIMLAEAYSEFGAFAEDSSLDIDETVRGRVLAGASVSARDYLKALSERAVLKEQFSAAFSGYDALLTPTAATPAIPVAAIAPQSHPTRFTRAANFLDLAALSVPNGLSGEGLPISLQIVCRSFDEATALRIGWVYERATDWHSRLPPVF